MREFVINCQFGDQIAPFTIFIGKPEPSHNAVFFQNMWLSKNRGGDIPAEIIEALDQLAALARKNSVSLEDLCVYALGTAQNNSDEESDEVTSS